MKEIKEILEEQLALFQSEKKSKYDYIDYIIYATWLVAVTEELTEISESLQEEETDDPKHGQYASINSIILVNKRLS